jgi:hypothetical protein
MCLEQRTDQQAAGNVIMGDKEVLGNFHKNSGTICPSHFISFSLLKLRHEFNVPLSTRQGMKGAKRTTFVSP